jgi:hypothetical protein
MHNSIITKSICVLTIACIIAPINGAFDTRKRAVKTAFEQARTKELITSKKKIEYKSTIVKQEQEKRAKMLAAAAAAPTLIEIRNMSGRIEIQKKGTQETALWVNGLSQKRPVLITPVGTQKAPANAFVLGSFYDPASKATRIAYIV